ncbi:hypothetical protein BGZ61DRAFT_495730 [Ilyonectria robusta]|uniref:uncharacterized protein n=1 Tax=Ilyonectria robusta TaxID=1079257 RepID=UPI001E8D1103|nr:uncharacterized protein BGZ61DRAFT_495730 [Ilyonectria robusta]KAH8684030.1 hypothetical protein BGZ61DRAFT_495730 [Ilyonectria robusta]
MRTYSTTVLEINESFMGAPSSKLSLVSFFETKPMMIPSLRKGVKRELPRKTDRQCQRTAIVGLGGVGKTQVALEVAFRIQELRGGPGDWLLIVDDADDQELFFGKPGETNESPPASSLDQYLPFSPIGSILFTTRNHEAAVDLLGSTDHRVTIEEMSKTEGITLLEMGLTEKQTGDPVMTTKLLKKLQNLPLAIRKASAFMIKKQITVAEHFEDSHRYKSIANPIATTWLISFRQIEERDLLAAKYLKYMSFLSKKAIPKSAIGTLKAYAFITAREEPDIYDIHRLVRRATRNWIEHEGSKVFYVTSMIQHLAKVYPPPRAENQDLWVKYLPHAETALKFQEYCSDGVAKEKLRLNFAKSCNVIGGLERCKGEVSMHHRSFTEAIETEDFMESLITFLQRLGTLEVAELHQCTSFGLKEEGYRNELCEPFETLCFTIGDLGLY